MFAEAQTQRHKAECTKGVGLELRVCSFITISNMVTLHISEK